MKTKIFFITILLICMTSHGYAEKIFLKNGSIVQGDLVENTGYAVRIKIGDEVRTIFATDIARILGDDEDVFAKTEQEKKDEKLYDEKKELVLRLLKANKAMENINLLFKQLLDQASPETYEKLKKIFKLDEIIEEIVPIYIKHYSLDELKDVVNFYNSPSGIKHIETTPIVMEETMRAAFEYFQKHGQEFMQKQETKDNINSK